MVHGSIERALRSCPPGPLAEAFEYVRDMDPETPEGEYGIRGRDMFVRVSVYDTLPRDRGRIESHRRYADIQVVLEGAEQAEWFAIGSFPEAAYDPSADVSFHDATVPARGVVLLLPGLFALFMPEDAHMPMLASAGGPGRVRKAVVKVDASLVRPSLLDWPHRQDV